MELEYLKNILQDLISRFSQINLPHVNVLKRELMHLGELEKELIRKKIIMCNYDVGASSVFIILKEANVLNVCEYLDNISDNIELLQIITDIFDDSVNCAPLIEEILTENKYKNQVEDALKNYIGDMLENSEMIQVEMITALEQNISKESFKTFVLPKFLLTLMHHPYEKVSASIDVISNQKSWNENFKNLNWLATIFKRIMNIYGDTITQEIINLIRSNDNCNWFFALFAIGFIQEDTESYKRMKKFFESQFKSFRTKNNEIALYKSLIIARQVLYYSDGKKSSSYKQFVKNNIGELNYTVKEKEHFINLIDTLQNIISYENDWDVLKIHFSIQISAPSREYSRILEYKKLLQSRLSALMEHN